MPLSYWCRLGDLLKKQGELDWFYILYKNIKKWH